MFAKKIMFLYILGVSSIHANQDMLKQNLLDVVLEVEKKKVEDMRIFDYIFGQRVKIEIIARDAIFIFMDINVSFHKDQMLKTAKKFDDNLKNMLKQDKDIEEVKKKYPKIFEEIEDLNKTWVEVYTHVNKISKDIHSKEDLEFIEEHDVRLLDEMTDVFMAFIKTHHSSNKLEAAMARTQNILFRQIEMPKVYLTKLLKDRLLIDNNFHKKETQEIFKTDIEDMDRLMKALKDGDKSLELIGTEDKKILDKLLVAQTIWEETRTLLLKENLSSKELEQLVENNRKFIEAHTEVVNIVRASIDI